jgi:hypothetical protein
VRLSLSALSQTGVARTNDRLRAVGHLQLTEDLGDVNADGLRTENEPLGDRAVGQPLGNQGQHQPKAVKGGGRRS